MLLNKKSCRIGMILFTCLLLAPMAALAQQAQLASVEQLKSEAFKALKGGEYDRTSELITQAATMSHDPVLVQMSEWVHRFQSERQEFVAERTKAFDKAVADVKKLHEKNYDEAAIDKTKDAHILAIQKDAFLKEPWV